MRASWEGEMVYKGLERLENRWTTFTRSQRLQTEEETLPLDEEQAIIFQPRDRIFFTFSSTFLKLEAFPSSYLLRLILKIQQRLGRSLEKQSKLVFAHWRRVGLVFALRRRLLLVEQLVEDARPRRQDRLTRCLKLFLANFHFVPHLDSAHRLARLPDQERDVTELWHRGEELEVLGQSRLVFERRLRLVLR